MYSCRSNEISPKYFCRTFKHRKYRIAAFWTRGLHLQPVGPRVALPRTLSALLLGSCFGASLRPNCTLARITTSVALWLRHLLAWASPRLVGLRRRVEHHIEDLGTTLRTSALHRRSRRGPLLHVAQPCTAATWPLSLSPGGRRRPRCTYLGPSRLA